MLSLFFQNFYVFNPGNPKGALLTHGNVISNTSAFVKVTEVKRIMIITCDFYVSHNLTEKISKISPLKTVFLGFLS